MYIMDEVMAKAIAEPRKSVGEYAPKIIQIKIDPEKIGDVVGQRGKTINAIIEETGVKIDISDEGAVSICGTDAAMMQKAVDLINIIVTDYEQGQIYTGKVISIKEFGAFLEFVTERRYGTHLQDCKRTYQPCKDVLTLGDVVKVVCLGKRQDGTHQLQHQKDVPKDAK